MAVAVLLLGGAAALYLHGVDQGASDGRDALFAERAALAAVAGRERLVLSSIAQAALFDALDGRGAVEPGELASLSAAVESNLSARIDGLYPRVAAGAYPVVAHLLFAHAAVAQATVDLASPFGGRHDVRVPAFPAVEGAVNLTIVGLHQAFQTTVPFSALHPLPTLLPASVASRVALEAGPGGRVERLVGQFAQRAMAQEASAPQGATWAADMVRLALSVDAALQFGSSGNATFDAALSGLLSPRGEFAAAALVGSLGTDSETLFGPVSRAFTVSGTPVMLEGLAVDFSNLTISPSWIYLDGQEAALGTWAALRIGASGSFAVTAHVASSAGAADVGPIEIPVSFTARAFQSEVPDTAIVPAFDLKAALADTAAMGGSSRYASQLRDAGFETNRTGFFNITPALESALLRFLANDARAYLPPLEDYGAFAAAHAPELATYANGTISFDFPDPATATSANLRVDGADLGAFAFSGNSIDVARLPLGVHSLQVTLTANGTRQQGAASFTVNGSGWRTDIPLAPLLDLEFLRAALARGQTMQVRAGLVLLTEAGEMVGLRPAFDLATLNEAAAYAGAALLRLEAMGVDGWADDAAGHRAEEALGFVKILFGLLKDADDAYDEMTNKTVPVGGLAQSLATLFVRGDPTQLADASIDALKIAKVAAGKEGITLTLYPGAASQKVLVFPMGQTLLVLTALANGLSLMADFVKIRDAFSKNTTADDGDRALALAGLGADLAAITVQTAQAAYRFMLSKAAFESMGSTFLRLTTAVTAVLVILDVIALYHESKGNFSLMWQTLVAPNQVLGLTRLPAIVAGATTVALNLLYFAGMTSFEAGPLGAIAALFVLAALLVANKEMVASAIFGTLPFDAVAQVRAQVGDAVMVAFAAASAANALDGPNLLQARRATAAHASDEWRSSATSGEATSATAWAARAADSWQRASALEAVLDASGRLRYAARALAEQADDFASPPFDVDPGRHTEGYRALHTLTGWFNFSGEVLVNLTSPGQPNATLGRAEWRALFTTISPASFPSFTCSYSLSDTNGIVQKEFSRWAEKLGAAGNLFAFEVATFQTASAAAYP